MPLFSVELARGFQMMTLIATTNQDVYWQQRVWIETKLCVDWAKNTFTPAMEDKQNYILFCDNLEGQTALPFQEEVRK